MLHTDHSGVATNDPQPKSSFQAHLMT